jgi:hypothetical protein
MKVEELVGSLQTYDLSLPQPKNNNFALRSSKKGVVESSYKDSFDFEAVSMLALKFRKFLRSSKGTSRTLSVDISNGNSQ